MTLPSERLARQVDDLQARVQAAVAAVDAAHADAAAASRMAGAAQDRLSTLALIQLSAAMRHSGRFETELAMVWAAGGRLDDLAPLLERVRPYAAFGIPSLPQLRRDFAALTSRLGRGSEDAGKLAWMAGLVGLSRPVPVPGDEATVLVSRIRTLLAEDDLAGALVVARQLPEPARAIVADWLDDAAARDGAEALARHVAALAGKSTGTPQ